MEHFLSALVMFTVIIDPPGVAAVYATLTAQHTEKESHAIATKACLIAMAALLAFGLIGAWLLSQLGISLNAFRIAGGLLLFVIAFRMLLGQPEPRAIQSAAAAFAERGNIAIFPLAIPLLSGPGCMTAMILLTEKYPSFGGRSMVFAAMAIAMLLAWICMLGVGRLMRFFGEEGIQILARLMGILLAALAIQFIVDGIKGFLGT
jgi:multiple antibiotic resistance protein